MRNCKEEQDCTDWQAYEETYANRIEIQINGEEMYIIEDAEDSFAQYYTYVSDTAPVMKDDRVYIPFRAVFEALGAEVQYDAGSKTITAKRGSREVALYGRAGFLQQQWRGSAYRCGSLCAGWPHLCAGTLCISGIGCCSRLGCR